MIVVLHQHTLLRNPPLVLRPEVPVQSAVEGDMKAPHINMQQPRHPDGCNRITTRGVIPARTAATRQTTTIIPVQNVEVMVINNRQFLLCI